MTARAMATNRPSHDLVRVRTSLNEPESPVITFRDVKYAESTGCPASTDDSHRTQPGTKVGGTRFWMIFVALMVSCFLSALDLTSVATTLPTIVKDLNGTEFVWVGSAYALGSTAILPLCGGLAQVFGRRIVVLGSLLAFSLGSGISGGAKHMTMLIAGRAIQGIGGGAIIALTDIVVADLVPLKERGTYMGVINVVWAIASAIGPPIGGAFSQSNWRWLFYMNLPISAVAMVVVFFALQLKTPREDFRTKIRRVDWFGNILVIVSTTISVIALTWAGVKYPWSSYQVLVPLVLGFVGLGAFLFYEARLAKEPVVPWNLVNNRTSLTGYLIVFLHGLVSTCLIFYLPVYFQGAKMQEPVRSGISSFPNAFTIAPAAIACGLSVASFSSYRPQNLLGWILTAIGTGLLSLLDVNSSVGKWVGFQAIEGIGLGILYSAPTFPVLAPLPVSQSAHALSLYTFVQSYSQTWGVAIGATILQNQLKKNLPSELLAVFPSEDVEISYAIIPTIKTLEDPLQSEVRQAFADALRVIWYTTAGLSVLGAVIVPFMEEIRMHEVTDEHWGLVDDVTKDIKMVDLKTP